jgi:rfaE bifunctional protein kinase chain/domain
MKKIIKINDLQKIRSNNKDKKIILAHGTYDFFHYGHLRHLLKSKNHAHILVVSITADNFVMKGPGRPIYNQKQRAEIISALSFVDYVVIVDSISGIEVIKSLKPDYYSKGVEYKDKSNDFTNKILLEEKILKKYDGKIVYTNEPVLSASSLINQINVDQNTPKEIFLKKFRKKTNFNLVYKNFNDVSKKKVLIIGDSILDEYIFTKALAKSPKEELISVKEDKRKLYMGGILATAKHISNFVQKPTLLTIIGNDTKTNNLIKNSFNNKECNLILFKDKKRQNIRKTRYLDVNQKKLFQSNDVPFEDIDIDLEKKVLSYLNKSLKNYDLVVVNDFGHGLLTEKIRRVLEKKSKKLSINVQSNSTNLGYSFFHKYKKCDYLTMDEPEARMATGERFGKIEVILKKVLKKIKAKKVAITYGPNGTKINSNGKFFNVPALSSNPVDTLGAGDAFFAISSIYSLIDEDPENIAFIGNLSGSLKIQYLGHEKYLKPDTFFPYLKSLIS